MQSPQTQPNYNLRFEALGIAHREAPADANRVQRDKVNQPQRDILPQLSPWPSPIVRYLSCGTPLFGVMLPRERLASDQTYKELIAVKFYIYISDAKIDMLLPQIPHDRKKKVATELGIDLKILTAKRTSEAESEENRITRLEAVVDFIREQGNLGTVDDPGEYVEGTLSMRWGPYGFDRENAPVYFGGHTDRTVIGLGGSSKHVIGNTGTSSADSHSATPYLLGYLREQELAAGEIKKGEYDGYMKNKYPGGASPEKQEDWGLRAVELATSQMKGPEQQLEFLAKRLLYSGYSSQKAGQILLASPLYVALAA